MAEIAGDHKTLHMPDALKMANLPDSGTALTMHLAINTMFAQPTDIASLLLHRFMWLHSEHIGEQVNSLKQTSTGERLPGCSSFIPVSSNN